MRRPFAPVRAAVAVFVSLGLLAGTAVSAVAAPMPAAQPAVVSAAVDMSSDEWIAGQFRTHFGVELSTERIQYLLGTSFGPVLRSYVLDAEFGKTAEAPTEVSKEALKKLADYIPSLFGASDPDPDAVMLDIISWDIAILKEGNLSAPVASALKGSVEAVKIAKQLYGSVDQVSSLVKMGLTAFSDNKYRQILSDYKEQRNQGAAADAAFAAVEEFLTDEYINNVATMRYPCTTWIVFPCLSGDIDAHLPKSREKLKQDLEFAYHSILLAESPSVKQGVKTFVTNLSGLIDGYSSQHGDFGLIAVQTGEKSITLINNGPATLSEIKLTAGDGKVLASHAGIGKYGRATVPDSDWASLYTTGTKFTFKVASVDGITRPAAEVRRAVWLDGIGTSAGSQPAERRFRANTVEHFSGTTDVAWDLGDGAQAAGPETTHVFKCYGTYKVQAKATHGSQSMTRESGITIGAPWTVDWSTEDGEYAAATGVPVKLFAHPSIPRDAGLQATWTFEDGGTAEGFEVEHAFPTKGTRLATLAITDLASGCPAYTKSHKMQVARTDEWITLPNTIDEDMVLTSKVAGYIIPQRFWYGSPHGTTVAAGAKLTIPPGVRIKGTYDPDAWGRYHNPLVVNGELEVRGAVSAPVEWTSWRDDALGGDANMDGDFTKPEPGDYLGVVAAAGSTVSMTNVSVNYSANFLDVQDGANVTVSNLKVRNASGYVYGALNGSYETGIISATGTGSLKISASDIENSAGNGYAIEARNAPNLRAAGLTLRGSGAGLVVRGEAGPSITNSTFIGFSEPIRTTAAASGFTARGISVIDGFARITVQAGQLMPGATSWSSSLPYILGGDITVPKGSSLRLAAGTAVKGQSGNSWNGVIYNPLRVAGTLFVDGTAAQPVEWTSIHDSSVRGPSYSGPAAPAPGDWAGIIAQDGSAVHISGLHAKFAAQVVGADAGSVVTVRDSRIEQSNADRMRYESVIRAYDPAHFTLSGISIDGAGSGQPLVRVSGSAGEAVISNSTFADANTAVDLQGSVRASLSGATFRNIRSSVLVQPATSGVKMAGTHVEGGMGRIVVSGGQLPEGANEWTADLPYVLLDQLTVPASSSLSIGAGVTLKSAVWHGSWSASYRPIQVFGSLTVNGTESQPVRWTSSRNADIGGPSEDVGTPAPTNYDWSGINANFGSSVSLKHVQATHARTLLEAQHGSSFSLTGTSVSNSDGQGYGIIRDLGATSAVVADSQFRSAGYGAALVMHGGQPLLERVTVQGAGHGIEVGGSAKPVIRGSALLADGYQILNYTSTAVDAGSNWWGDENGPSTGTAGLEPYFGTVKTMPWCLQESCQTLSSTVPALISAPETSRQSVTVEGSFGDVKVHADRTDGTAAVGAVLAVKLSGPAAFAGGAQEQELTADENGDVIVPGPIAGTEVGAVTLTVTAKAAPGLSPLVLNLGDVRAGTAAAIHIVGGGGATATPGSDLGSLSARVVDRHGNPVSGADVEFVLDGPAVFGETRTAVGTSNTEGLVASPAVTATDTAGEVSASASLVENAAVKSEFPRFVVAAAAKETVPAGVVFTDEDGTAQDTYTVPVVDGVEYLVGEKVTEAGTYPGTGTVTVTARAKTDFVFKAGAVTEWSATFKATPYVVVPAAVVFTDEDGTAQDTYTVPVVDGVEYLVGEKVTEAGTYPGTGTVTVTARAKTDFVFKAGAVTEWSATFKATPYEVTRRRWCSRTRTAPRRIRT